MDNPLGPPQFSDILGLRSSSLEGQSVESRSQALARAERAEILALLRANQAEILQLTALTQRLACQLQGEDLVSDQLPLVGHGDWEMDQAETQGEYDQPFFLPPSPGELPPLVTPISVGAALARPPEDLEAFEFNLPQVACEPPLAVVQDQPRQAYRFMETLTDRVNLEMIAIPGGQVQVTRPEDSDRSVRGHDSGALPSTAAVEDFFMGRYPVTQAQWRAVARLPGVNRPLHPDPSHFKGDDRPVERISWHDAVEFCDRLSAHTGRAYRLPTETEWEYACRAGTTTPFNYGPSLSPQLANYRWPQTELAPLSPLSPGHTTPVDQFEYANGFGLSDMHGNVLEWCQDAWPGAAEVRDGVDDLLQSQPVQRVLRGGCWLFPPEQCTADSRQAELSLRAYDYIGLRVCCSSLAKSPVVRQTAPITPILVTEIDPRRTLPAPVLVMKRKAKQHQLVKLSGLCLAMGLLGGSAPEGAVGRSFLAAWQPLAPSAEMVGQSAALLFHSAQIDQLAVAAPEPLTATEEIVPQLTTIFHYDALVPYLPDHRTLPRGVFSGWGSIQKKSTERKARATGRAGATPAPNNDRKSGWDGASGLRSRLDDSWLGVGERVKAPGRGPSGVAPLPPLWESATVERISVAADGDLGGRHCLKATGGSLSSGMPRESAGAARRTAGGGASQSCKAQDEN
jgi:formylglycine-generating enzyme required for sulfatase activity